MPRSSTPSMSMTSMFTPRSARQLVRRAAMPVSLGTRTVSCFIKSVRGSRFRVPGWTEGSGEVGDEYVDDLAGDVWHDNQVADLLFRSDDPLLHDGLGRTGKDNRYRVRVKPRGDGVRLKLFHCVFRTTQAVTHHRAQAGFSERAQAVPQHERSERTARSRDGGIECADVFDGALDAIDVRFAREHDAARK